MKKEIISLPKILRDRLTDEGADAFVQILDKVEERSQQATLEIAEQKFEARIAHLDAKIDRVAAELEAKIAQTESQIILWMFVSWVGQVGTILGILFVFFKK